ncbi:MAG: lipocalin family protein [Flavobacteriales bacterium]
MKSITVLIISILLMVGCKAKKELATVSPLDLEQYRGTWYEIARFDHSFEKNLSCVSATYTIREDGKVDVLNKGYNTKKEKWSEANGIAKVPNAEKPGEIKVSFFRPFYGDYFVMKLDKDYKHVLVGSPTRKFLWVLSRTKTMSQEVYANYINFAEGKGFDTSKLMKVAQVCK